MAKMKKRHFHTRTPLPNLNPNHQPPHLNPNHHSLLQTIQQPPLLHHPNHHHQYQPQPHYSNYENTLIEEVLYLHSLWHRGPPSSSSSHRNSHLKPSHTTHFKTTRTQVSDKEWPVPDTHISEPGSGSVWPGFCSLNKPVSRPVTDKERVRVMGVRIQLKGVDSCSGLFRRRGEDEDADDDDDDDDDDYDGDEIDFFENLFEENEELRGFYKENCENGEFYCLVCGVIGGKNKLGRKFKNCVALVQHSVSISKTKKKKAHRVYGNVICKVLGWDVDSLPSLPLHSILKTIEGAKEVKNHADEDSTVEMEMDGESKIVPDALEKDNVTSTRAGCIASEVTEAEAERKDSADECKVDNQVNVNHRLCRNSETDVSQRQNYPELPQENAVQKVEEERSVPGFKPLE